MKAAVPKCSSEWRRHLSLPHILGGVSFSLPLPQLRSRSLLSSLTSETQGKQWSRGWSGENYSRHLGMGQEKVVTVIECLLWAKHSAEPY